MASLTGFSSQEYQYKNLTESPQRALSERDFESVDNSSEYDQVRLIPADQQIPSLFSRIVQFATSGYEELSSLLRPPAVTFSNQDKTQGMETELRFGNSHQEVVVIKLARLENLEPLEREYRFLEQIQKVHHVVQLHGPLRGIKESSLEREERVDLDRRAWVKFIDEEASEIDRPVCAMVMKKAGEVDLSDWLLDPNERHVFSLKEITTLAKQLLETLREIHRKGIIHRDIKPENIVFNPETQEFTLIDFGGASNPSEKQLYGTPYYMAPEFALKLLSNPEQDIWSLGATLFTAFTNEILYQDVYDLEQVSRWGLIKNLQKEFGEIPQSIIGQMEDGLKDIFFKKEKGKYVLIEPVPFEPTWQERIRAIGQNLQESEEDIELFIDLLNQMFCFENRPTANQLLSHRMLSREISFPTSFPVRQGDLLQLTSLSLDEQKKPLHEKFIVLSQENARRCWHFPNLIDNSYRIRMIRNETKIWEKIVTLSQGTLLEIKPNISSRIANMFLTPSTG